MASFCLGDRKHVQDARFDRQLTGVKKKVFIGARKQWHITKAFRESQHPSPQG